MTDHSIDILFLDLIYKTNISKFSNLKSYLETLVFDLEKEQKKYEDGWLCNTFNTLGGYDLLQNKTVEPLLLEIKEHCYKFSIEYGITNQEIKYKDAWLNLARKNCFQEMHNHCLSHFSAIYYVKVPENCGCTVFFSKDHNNMFPLPLNTNTTIANSKIYKYEPIENDLVIFRSDVFHMVEQNRSNDNRITMSMNLTVEK